MRIRTGLLTGELRGSRGRSWWVSMKRLLASAVFCGVMIFGIGPDAGTSPALTTVVAGQGFVDATPTGFWVAKEKGFFRRYRLDVKFVLFRGGTQTTQALIALTIPLMLGVCPSNSISASIRSSRLQRSQQDRSKPFDATNSNSQIPISRTGSWGPAGSLAAAAGGVDIVELVIPGPAMPYLFVSRGTGQDAPGSPG